MALALMVGMNARAQDPDRHDDDIFFDNAFEQALVGERPRSLMPGDVNRLDGSGTSRPVDGRPRWSTLISATTLEDEIKSLNETLSSALRSPSQFASGGNETASDAFELLSVLFAIVDEYDGDVRWKRQSLAARQRFAKAAVLSQDTDAASFASAHAAHDDLRELLGGGDVANPDPASFDSADSFDRAPLMRRLDTAMEQRLRLWLARDDEYRQALPAILHEAELLAAISAVLRQDDMPDATDDEYRKYARTLRAAADELAASARQNDFEGSQQSFAAIQRSCEQCHEGYR